MKSEITIEKRLAVWQEIRELLVQFINSRGWEYSSTTGLCKLIAKVVTMLDLPYFMAYTSTMKDYWPEFYAYKPKWHTNAWWWSTDCKKGYTTRLSIVDRIIADLTIKLEETKNGFRLYLTADQVNRLRRILSDEYLKMEYNLRSCAANALLSNYPWYVDALREDGSTSVGTINGPKLIKHMSKEVFEELCKVDPHFAKIVTTTVNGKSHRFLTTFIRENNGKYYRKLYRNCEYHINNYGDGIDRPSIEYAGKQLTYEQFDRWRKKFEAKP